MDVGQIAVLAASIGAAATILGVLISQLLQMAAGRVSFAREEDGRLRIEKRRAYAEVIQAVNQFREATAEIADAREKKLDWEDYYAAHSECLHAGAALQLVGTNDMLITYSEGMDALMDVGWTFYEHPGLNPNIQDPESRSHFAWSHISAADRHFEEMRNLFRLDLGAPPLDLRARDVPVSDEDKARIEAAVKRIRGAAPPEDA